MRDKHRFINAGFPSKWGDQGDGTYCNPILPADYSDPDVVRVGEDYFMAVSTFQQSGGVDILHSKDLVNWQTVSHAIPDVGILGPRFRWDHINNYGAGVFAPSIHYVNGKFRVYVNCYKGEGFFSATAEEAVGPWEVRQLEDKNGKPMRAEPWTDPDVFWDDNGEAYMAAAYLGTHSLYLFRMSPDGTRLLDADVDNLPQSGTIFYQIEGTEGNKIFKRNGYYYLFNVDFQGRSPAGRGGYVKRARHLYGIKQDGSAGGPGDPGIYEVRFLGHQFPSQGGFIDTPQGDWYFIGQYDDGGAAGRRVHLVPVVWMEDWPFMGSSEKGIPNGSMVWRHQKPNQEYPVVMPQHSDDFNASTLSPIWFWNHSHRDEYWSLNERQGYLRLRAFGRLKRGSFFHAGNTIAQRYFLASVVQADIKFDLKGMFEGQEAGLSHFNGGTDYCNIGVVQCELRRKLKYESNGNIVEGPWLPNEQNTIWLRTSVNASCVSQFYYSFDGCRFTSLGDEYSLRWGGYRGDNIGIYTFNDKKDEGFIDVDWFHYSHSGPASAGEICVETNDLTVRKGEYDFFGVYRSDGFGHQEDISSIARYECHSEIISVNSGRVYAIKEGRTEITVFVGERSWTIRVRVIGNVM